MFFGTCYHAGWLKHCEMGYIKASKKRLHAAVQLGWSKYSLNQLVSIPSPYLGAIFFVSGRCMRARPVLQPCALHTRLLEQLQNIHLEEVLLWTLDSFQDFQFPDPVQDVSRLFSNKHCKIQIYGTYVYISHITHTHNYIYTQLYI